MSDDVVQDQRPLVEQTHDPVQGLPRQVPVDDGRDDCLPQAGRRAVYLDPNPKEPSSLDLTVTNLELMAGELDTKGTLGAIRLRDLRRRVISAAIVVKGCAGEWRRERERELPQPRTTGYKVLFFGPDCGGSMLAQDMEKAQVLPESTMEDRLNELAKEGWRVIHQSFTPSYTMMQWRVVMERA